MHFTININQQSIERRHVQGDVFQASDTKLSVHGLYHSSALICNAHRTEIASIYHFGRLQYASKKWNLQFSVERNCKYGMQ